jgi:hypothetical protein
MKFVLITAKGKVLTFSVKACAEIFQQAYGGTLIDNQLYAEAYDELLVDN